MSLPPWEVRCGDSLTLLCEMPDASVHCVVTSPPYWALRRYHAGPQEMGSETTLTEYIAGQVAAFREVRRILRNDGVCWLVPTGQCPRS